MVLFQLLFNMDKFYYTYRFWNVSLMNASVISGFRHFSRYGKSLYFTGNKFKIKRRYHFKLKLVCKMSKNFVTFNKKMFQKIITSFFDISFNILFVDNLPPPPPLSTSHKYGSMFGYIYSFIRFSRFIHLLLSFTFFVIHSIL